MAKFRFESSGLFCNGGGVEGFGLLCKFGVSGFRSRSEGLGI